MKKLFLIAAFGVAGMVSAKEHKVQDISPLTNSQLVLNSKNMVAKPHATCFPFTLSCGITGTACGSNTAELLE